MSGAVSGVCTDLGSQATSKLKLSQRRHSTQGSNQVVFLANTSTSTCTGQLMSTFGLARVQHMTDLMVPAALPASSTVRSTVVQGDGWRNFVR